MSLALLQVLKPCSFGSLTVTLQPLSPTRKKGRLAGDSGQESSGLGWAGSGVSTGPGKPGRSVTSYKELIRGKLE